MLPTPESLSQPIAVVNGTPLNQLPDDLYIPPDALAVFLASFEGPLDLLLYLIRRQNLDIIALSMAEISEQYLAYIQMMDGLNIELAADYLVMSAWLAEIKSRLLLPRQSDPEADADEEDPRALLVRRLQEYERIKFAAEYLDALPRMERDFIVVELLPAELNVLVPIPEVLLKDVLFAFQSILKRAEHLSHHAITQEALSVRERMATILAKLKSQDSLDFTDCFERNEGRQGVVVTFLAILELSKEQLIDIIQHQPFSTIRLVFHGAC